MKSIIIYSYFHSRGQPLKQSTQFLVLSYYLLTIKALSYNVRCILLHPTPPIMLPQISIHLRCPRVNKISGAVSHPQYRLNNISNLWNTHINIKPQNTLRIKCSLHKLTPQHLTTNATKSTILKLMIPNILHQAKSSLKI